MRQRVAIARTLILRPRIILMDEPFGALDPNTRLNMQDQLVDLWRGEEATVFFVTHSVEEAVYLGDRVYVLSPSPGRLYREIAGREVAMVQWVLRSCLVAAVVTGMPAVSGDPLDVLAFLERFGD